MSSEPPTFLLDVGGQPPQEQMQQLLNVALYQKASDVFLGSDRDGLSIQMRHLGIVKPLAKKIPRDEGRRLVSHLKAMADMDIAEKRHPQDGRWLFQNEKQEVVDIRVNILPTLYGEDVSMRLLPRISELLQLDKLGMMKRQYDEYVSWLNSPSGLILVTGPTGSGKTTTLYASLNYLNDGSRKINSIEDPVEYSLDGVRQAQISEKMNLHFADLLRNVLRQGPDVIMIGEIRDPETAGVAVRAANSGHLVFATLHSPTAAGAIQSMLALGVQPHFLATSLLGSLSQRLVRTLNQALKIPIDISLSMATFEEILDWLPEGEETTIYSPGSSPDCPEGYDNRTGVFELMHVTQDIRELILKNASASEIQAKAIEHGMIEFRRAALLKVAEGITTVEEVLRAIPSGLVGAEEDD